MAQEKGLTEYTEQAVLNASVAKRPKFKRHVLVSDEENEVIFPFATTLISMRCPVDTYFSFVKNGTDDPDSEDCGMWDGGGSRLTMTFMEKTDRLYIKNLNAAETGTYYFILVG